jgi:translocation and assembly module TamB
MRRALRITAWTLAAVLAVAVLLLAGVLIAGNTGRGRALIESMTARLTNGQVRLSGLSGSFPGEIELDRLELADAKGVWLSAERIYLHWSPLELAERRIHVATLRVARLDIERAPLESSSSESTPSVPHIDVEQFDIGTLTLGAALARVRTALTVSGSAHLRSLQDAYATLSAKRVDGAPGDYQLTLRFDPVNMDGHLKITEPGGGTIESLLGIPGLGALSVVASLAGPRGSEQVELAASAGMLKAHASGSVDLEHASAELTWGLDAPAMTLRPGLAWQRIAWHGSWHGPFETPHAQGDMRIDALEAGGARLASLAGTMQADRGGLAVHAVAEGVILPGPQPQLLAAFPLTVDAALRLDDPQHPVQLSAMHRLFALKAALITASPRSANFEVRFPDLSPLAALLGHEIRGRGEVKGTLRLEDTASRIELEATTDVQPGTTLLTRLVSGMSRLRLKAALSEKSLDLERLEFTGRELSASLGGRAIRGAAASPAVQSVDGRYEATLNDLALLSSAIGGSVALKGNLSGPVDSLTTQLQVNSSLSIRGAPREVIQGSIRARGLPDRLSATVQALGNLEGARVQLAASVQRVTGGGLQIRVQQGSWRSAQLHADLMTGADFTPERGSAEVHIDRLADLEPLLGLPLAGRLSAQMNFTPANQTTRARLRADGQELRLGGLAFSAHLGADGPLDALNLRLTAESPDLAGAPASVDVGARLNLSGQALNVRRAAAHYHDQTLRLLAPATVGFADGVTLGPLRLAVQHALLELEGRVSPVPDLRASVQKVDAPLVNAFVPGLLAQGSLEASAQIHGSFTAPVGEVTLRAQGVRLAGVAARNLQALDARASAQLAGTSARLDAHLTAGPASQLAITGSAPLNAAGAIELKVTGNLDAALANPFLEARGERATGTIAVNADITGTPGAADIGGTVDIRQGDLRDYAQGLHLSGITGHLVGSAGTLKIESLVAHAAAGQLTVSGTIGVLEPKLPVDLLFTASNAQPITSDLLTTNINASVKLTGNLRERADLKGTLDLHRTVIGIPNAFPPDVAVLDVRRPGQAQPAAPEQKLVVGLDLDLRAPREILVQGRGLNAELGGELHILGTTDDPRVAGSFDMLRGTFALASTQLTFTDGRVSFNGAGLHNQIDPSLDFTAQATAANATTTLHITGLATAPQFTLSSTPPLPEDEILARLLFGESASQLSALQIGQIGVALATLSGVGGGGPNPLAKVQRALGLDRLSVGSGTTNATTGQTTGAALEAGRYVSSRVFVGAKQSTTGYSQVEVDVDLSKHLKLQTRLGNGTAIQGTTPENDPGSTIGFVYQLEY